MPPIASVSPSLTTTCVMAVRLLMLGMGPAAELMSSPLELFSTLTIILTRVMSPASRMTVGVTSSLSRASLNWTCVPAELTVAYGISLPSEIVALAFSSVTTSGFASDVVLLSASSASRTRLTLNFPPTIPKAMAAGLRPANEPLGRTGKSTMFPPVGNPVAPLTGRKLPSVNPGLTLGSFLPVSGATGLPTGGNIVDFPVLPSGSFAGLSPAAIAFGIVGGKFNVNLVLDALEADSKTTSLAKPEVVTLENAKATISLGSEIPYATVSSAGTQVQFKDALLKLDVTPTVIREAGDITRVKMIVNVENNSKGDDINSAAGPIPSINRRTAITQVVVKEGETLAIGGIRQHQSVESTRKVPFFGDIPVLGFLFRTKSTLTDPNRELVVFITPYVLKLDLSPAPPGQQPKK